jgi:hypothetical protein
MGKRMEEDRVFCRFGLVDDFPYPFSGISYIIRKFEGMDFFSLRENFKVPMVTLSKSKSHDDLLVDMVLIPEERLLWEPYLPRKFT